MNDARMCACAEPVEAITTHCDSTLQIKLCRSAGTAAPSVTTMKSKLRKVRMGTVGCCVFVLPKSSLHRHRKEQASGITAGTPGFRQKRPAGTSLVHIRVNLSSTISYSAQTQRTHRSSHMNGYLLMSTARPSQDQSIKSAPAHQCLPVEAFLKVLAYHQPTRHLPTCLPRGCEWVCRVSPSCTMCTTHEQT